jgi:2-C-methyl-D-erythritol 2,4-cyclodiphosphate synthase
VSDAPGEQPARPTSAHPSVRLGIGYDSHRFVAGRPLVLGGITIPHAQGLKGHSDADAVAHALTDAILGAAGAGNIGQLFPDDDPQWKDADSMELLRTANELVRGRGHAVVQADVTVITEAPRLAAHLGAMSAALASRLGLAASAISVKAKTNEGMGFIGRGEGLAVIAVATLEAR